MEQHDVLREMQFWQASPAASMHELAYVGPGDESESEIESDESEDSYDSHDLAQRQWEESLQQLADLLTLVLIPVVGRYFGRRFAYTAWRWFKGFK